MQVAKTPQHRFLGMGIVLQGQAGIFLQQLVDGIGQFLFVAARRRADGQSEQRDGEAQRARLDLILVVGIVQHHAAMDFVHLGHGADISRNAGGHFRMFLAVHVEQMADLKGFAAVADVQLAVFIEGALMDPENAELADKGVDQHLEHMRHQVLARIGRAVQEFGIRGSLQERFRVGLGGVGKQFDEDVQQFLTPAPVRAETKQIGIKWPSRKAFSNGACSCSGWRSSP